MSTQLSQQLSHSNETLRDGWVPANETWAYASASTITVPSGAASKYQKGDRLRFKQGAGYKYYVLTAVADTTLTVLINTDYTVANAAITDNYYSHEMNPFGYPDWFNATAPTWSSISIDNGSGGQPTTNVHRVRVTGRIFESQIQASGTKAGTNVVGCRFDPSTLYPPYISTIWHSIGYGFIYNETDDVSYTLYGFAYLTTGFSWNCDADYSIPDNKVIGSLGVFCKYEI